MNLRKTLSFKLLITIALSAVIFTSCNNAKSFKIESLQSTVENAQPGDTVIIPNGTYKDIALVIEGKGTKENPIVVMAENPGEVFIEGASTLRFAGEFVEINGLFFRNGFSPEGPVIEFKNGDKLANNSRITNCAIEYYNPEDRSVSYSWIALYGRLNRFDHNSIVGKLNSEVTLYVSLDGEENQKNSHRIDHNYFGDRPNYGSNGGETMRIGNSQYSQTSSLTTIEDNYFEHCSGEVEVISIKSEDNIIRRNTLFECEGSIVLRHGKGNTVSRNKIIGNNKLHTGGIRIINGNQTVIGNYLSGLKGDRFRSALSIMNGVPNSRPNRYHQVENAIIKDNYFVDCDNIALCVGSDNERTATPINSLIANNFFINKEKDIVYAAYDKIDGITFSDNKVVTKSGKFKQAGFEEVKESDIVIPSFEDVPTKEQTGAFWYKHTVKDTNPKGKTITVNAGQNSLNKAIEGAKDGDIIVLNEAKIYLIDKSVRVSKKIKIEAKAGLKTKPAIQYNGVESKSPMVVLADSSEVIFTGISFYGEKIDGKTPPMSGVSPAEKMRGSYKAKFYDCEFSQFSESYNAAFLAMKTTYADTLVFSGCNFHSMSGQGINLSAEKDDKGRYSAEYLLVENCTFKQVMNCAIDLYRGGTDESTTGPRLDLYNCVFDDVNNQERGSALRLLGPQVVNIDKAVFKNSGRGGGSMRFDESPWDKISITNCTFVNSGKIQSYSGKISNK